jgi:hypothetical protein
MLLESTPSCLFQVRSPDGDRNETRFRLNSASSLYAAPLCFVLVYFRSFYFSRVSLFPLSIASHRVHHNASGAVTFGSSGNTSLNKLRLIGDWRLVSSFCLG